MLDKFKDIRIAVIVALAEEYKVFRQYFPGNVVEKFHIGDLDVDIVDTETDRGRIGLVCLNQMGNVAAGIAAARLLEVFDLDIVVNLGLAAGVDSSKQALGDIVVAEKIRYYESGKMKSDVFEAAPEYSNVRSHFVSALQEAEWLHWPLGVSLTGQPRKVSFGTIASGDKVIANSEFVRTLLKQDRKTVGIEMESYGIAAALFGRKEKFLLIRGISDFADESKSDDGRLSAMEGAVRFFDQSLRHGLLSRPSDRIHRIDTKHPTTYSIFLTKKEMRDGVTNSYVQISRTQIIDDFKYRRTLIQRIASKFTMDELRSFCITLKIDFDELRGETKSAKAASLLEHVERKGLLTAEELDSLLSDE